MSSEPMLMMMQAAPASGPGGVGALFSSFLVPMLLVFGIFYILVQRPQSKRAAEHRASIMAVKKGDEVITGGGIRGKVTKVSDDEAEVEIAQGVKIRVIKSTISQVLSPNAKSAND
jgi:preprotein translocase subunit YajC